MSFLPDDLIASALRPELMQAIRDRHATTTHLTDALRTTEQTAAGDTQVVLNSPYEGALVLATVPEWAADAGMADHIKHAHRDIEVLLAEVDRLQALAGRRGQELLNNGRR